MPFIENIQKSGREINVRITILGSTPIIIEQDEIYKIDKVFEADFFRTSMTQIDGEIKGRYDLTNKVLKIELGVSFEGSPYEYVNFGEFIVKEHERIVGNTPQFDKTTFKAFDKMVLFHKPYDVVELGITYPISVFNLLSTLATNVGLTLDNVSIVNGSMMIEEDKWTGIENVTYRNILDEIAQTSGSTILISNNKLKAKYTGSPVIELFEENLRTLKIEEEYGSINILNLTREPQHDNYVYPSTWETIPVEDRYEIVFANNQIMDKRRDEYAPALFNSIDDINYFPFEAETTGLVFLEPMDVIEVTDMNNITHLSYVMHSRLKVSSGIKETLKALVPVYAQQDYVVVTDNQKQQSRTEFLIDKVNGEITSIVSDFDELEGQVETNTSEIQQTKNFFSLTFTKNLHEMKNKLVYGDTIHMFGAEVGENVGFTEINVAVPEVYFMSTNQGTNTYYFMPTNEISLYNLKLGQPYTFSATLISDIVPSTAQPANDVGVSVYYYVSGSSTPILLTAKIFKALDEELSNFITFTLPANAVGWNMKMEVVWSLQGAYTFMHFLMKNAQLEEGSSVTAFSNSASTISGARYVFNGDNASFYNGGLRIFNKDNTQVFGADTEGDLWTQSLRIYGSFRTDNTVYFVRNTGKAISSINAIANSPDIWNDLENTVAKFTNSNNALAILVGGTSNNREAIIQVGHNNVGSGNNLGTLHLNRFGGDVTVNDNSVWHTGNFNPANYLEKTGGSLTGSLTIENNQELRLKASVGSTDAGDIVWLEGDNSEQHRLWGSTGLESTLYYRYKGGATRKLWHDGNLDPYYLYRNTGKTIASIDATASSSNAWNVLSNDNLKLTNNNNSLAFLVGGTLNDRSAIIQVGHESSSFANVLGALYLNKFGGNVFIGENIAYHAGNVATLSAGNGISGSSYNGSTARTWSIGAGTGISVDATTVGLTSIASGSGTVGALRYNGTSKISGTLYGGTDNPTVTIRLNYDGYFYAYGIRYGAGGSSSYSDIRMKKDVGSLNYAEQLILSLKPKQFRFKTEFEAPEEVVPSKRDSVIPTSNTANRDKLQYGFIAQDVEKVLDKIGIKRSAIIKEPNKDSEYYGLDYTQLIAPMIDVIQKQQKRIDEIERLLERLS